MVEPLALHNLSERIIGSGEGPRPSIENVLMAYRSYGEEKAEGRIREAHQFAEEAHAGQTRISGEPYITHPLAVAQILTELQQQETAVVAGLLHDVLEDTSILPEDLKKRFGTEVAFLVEGVTKVSRLSSSLLREQHAEYVRRMLMAMARDIRVVIIKLSDRLHNMLTLSALPYEKQIRIARSTMDIYAPLANRMGMGRIKWELEDLAMARLHPEEYQRIRKHVDAKRAERERYVMSVREILAQRLEEHDVEGQVFGRAKHFFSIYQKMVREQTDLESIYDLVGLRVLTGTVADCYQVLGVVHEAWMPVAGRFRDYISTPKQNGYKSIHTTVLGPGGRHVEVQIRTREMHSIAEEGVAAHWRYKEGREKRKLGDDARWLTELNRLLRETENPDQVMDSLRVNLFTDEIYVYTPKGEIVRLPAGSTPIDFAYKIHTELGQKTAGAKIGNRFVSLSNELKTGDVVEIIVGHGAHPHPDWLNIAKTAKARSKICKFLRESQRDTLLSMGRSILSRELSRIGKEMPAFYKSEEMEEIVRNLACKSLDDLWVRIGFGRISSKQVLGRILHREPTRRPHIDHLTGSTIRVEEIDGIQYRRAACCNPLPGEPIVGIVTKGRGISIHKEECVNARRFAGENGRKIPLHWDARGGEKHEVILNIVAKDRNRLLADITGEISATGTNIISSRSQPHSKTSHMLYFNVHVVDINHLNRITQRLIDIEGVQSVCRRQRG